MDLALGAVVSICRRILYYCYCIEKFRDSSANHNQIPRKTEALHSVINSAAAEARKVKIGTQMMLVYILCSGSKRLLTLQYA